MLKIQWKLICCVRLYAIKTTRDLPTSILKLTRSNLFQDPHVLNESQLEIQSLMFGGGDSMFTGLMLGKEDTADLAAILVHKISLYERLIPKNLQPACQAILAMNQNSAGSIYSGSKRLGHLNINRFRKNSYGKNSTVY